MNNSHRLHMVRGMQVRRSVFPSNFLLLSAIILFFRSFFYHTCCPIQVARKCRSPLSPLPCPGKVLTTVQIFIVCFTSWRLLTSWFSRHTPSGKGFPRSSRILTTPNWSPDFSIFFSNIRLVASWYRRSMVLGQCNLIQIQQKEKKFASYQHILIPRAEE